ncbi:hypothetical protein RMSM_06475 [Rhodopirellula maiorica SM1]|uniref:Uncharacterized protein n=1 Tax=Rhodopirellula maiorica SM1 TaxID=1265738 RepID=M5RC09_9BACT|nr:hypothetical protein RMSM_06475 [Rhodopirellula maiorica SM1]
MWRTESCKGCTAKSLPSSGLQQLAVSILPYRCERLFVGWDAKLTRSQHARSSAGSFATMLIRNWYSRCNFTQLPSKDCHRGTLG